MKTIKILLIGFSLIIGFITMLVTSVHAANYCFTAQRGSGSNYAATNVYTNDEGPTYNNYVYAKTLAWSVKDDGGQLYHEGPTSRQYNSKSAYSIVYVPDGRGQWYECHSEGRCNRCGSVLEFSKHMFAF